MTENWLNDSFCEVTDEIRIEQGAQIVEVTLTKEIMPLMPGYYFENGVDAYGKSFIEFGQDDFGNVTKEILFGTQIHIVDRNENFKPKIWNVYQYGESDRKDGLGFPIKCFNKIADFDTKEEALDFARGLN